MIPSRSNANMRATCLDVEDMLHDQSKDGDKNISNSNRVVGRRRLNRMKATSAPSIIEQWQQLSIADVESPEASAGSRSSIGAIPPMATTTTTTTTTTIPALSAGQHTRNMSLDITSINTLRAFTLSPKSIIKPTFFPTINFVGGNGSSGSNMKPRDLTIS